VKLYEITSVMRALMDSISDRPLNEGGKPLDGAGQAEHDGAVAAFEGATADLDMKLRAIIAYSLELEAGVEARLAVMDRMQKANDRDQKKANFLRDYAKGAIDAVGLSMPRKFPEFALGLTKNPQVAEITDEALLPAEYKTTTTPEPVTKIDKKKLNTDVKDGIAVPGARLSAPSYRLVIK